MLTMRELARAQGFSDDFEFTGSVDEVNRQVSQVSPHKDVGSNIYARCRSEMQSSFMSHAL